VGGPLGGIGTLGPVGPLGAGGLGGPRICPGTEDYAFMFELSS
jgi:hypothetical protein